MSSSSVLDDYEVLETIGRGSYGHCRKVRRRKDGHILVWKELYYGEMTETEKQLVVSEVNLLREFRHPNIVRYYDRIIDRSSAVIYIIMEFCEGGDLSSLIKRYKERGQKRGADEAFVWRCLNQLCSALRECHNRTGSGCAVLHRDLKPANVFLDREKNIKLGDFGLARVLQHDNSFAKTFVGTPYYMSPEQMHRRAYNEKSDIWSLGCLIYELCALHPPFLAKNQKELAVRIRRGNYARLPSGYSDQLHTIIDSMLQVNEAKRPNIESLYQTIASANASRHKSESSSTKCPVCRTPSKDSDLTDSYKEHLTSLKKREDDVQQKEQEIKKRLQDLTKRENAVSLLQKVAEDKMKKAESMMKEATSRRRDSVAPLMAGDVVRTPSRRGGTALTSLGDFSPINSPPISPSWNRRPDTPKQSCLKKDSPNQDCPRDFSQRKTVTFLSSGVGPCPLGSSPSSLPSSTSSKRSKDSADLQAPILKEIDENADPDDISDSNFSSIDSERRTVLRQRWERARVRSEMLEKLEKEIMERCQTVLKISSESN